MYTFIPALFHDARHRSCSPRLFIPLLLLFCLQARAETTLSGNIGNMTFTPSGNPYIVNDNIIIQEGMTTTIQAGCVFLFHPFSGIVVNGSLSVEGTLQSPVVFTSAFDGNYSKDAKQPANPFDWNGVFISQLAGKISISNIILAYSVYGIKSQKEALSLNNATFKSNGQFHFTVDEQIQHVEEGVPFNYVTKQKAMSGNPPIGDTAKPKIREKKHEKSTFRKALPVILAATGLATGIGTVYSLKKASDHGSAYSNEVDPEKRTECMRKYSSALQTGIILGGITAVCLPVSAILFVKDHKDKTNPVKVNVAPTIGHEMGITLTIAF